jgi:glutamine cyclotransferase
MNNLRISFFVMAVFFCSVCCVNDSRTETDFKIKNRNSKNRLGEAITGEVKSNSFDAVRFFVVENKDTLLVFEGSSKNFNFTRKNLTVGNKNISITGVNEEGDLMTKIMQVQVFSNIKPLLKKVNVIREYKHNVSDYTQGLFFDGDTLFESTGLYGESKVKKYILGEERILVEEKLDKHLFGEGITLLNDKIYELTWKSGKVLVYDRDFNLLEELVLPFKAEGWGLTNDGENLIMSDGSEKIRFLNPETLKVESQIEVYDNQRKLNLLNELELVNGKLYANIYQSNYIVEIDVSSGVVLSYLDCSYLKELIDIKADTDVLNGIAYDSESSNFFLTGKKWSKIFEVTFN